MFGGITKDSTGWRPLLRLSRPPVDIALETLEFGAFEQRLVRICHALDRLHVARLPAEERRAGRDKLPEDVALQRVSTATARDALETRGGCDCLPGPASAASLLVAANGETATDVWDAQPGASP